jgi:polysaccharide export outer membrane protein
MCVAISYRILFAEEAVASNGEGSYNEGNGIQFLTDYDPSEYILSPEDIVQIDMFREPEITKVEKLDKQGIVRFHLLDEVKISGITIRDAESYLEKLYIEEGFFIHPKVTLRLISYSKKSISILGEVRNKGKLTFDGGEVSLKIVEVITRVGGFTDLAKGDEVLVTRVSEDGKEKVFNVNVDRLLKGKEELSNDKENIVILPGDFIYVPRRLF